MNKLSLFLGGALFAIASVSSAAKFYKWVDENGVTHYDSQPPKGIQATEVNTRADASSSQREAIDALNTRREADRRSKQAATAAAEEARRLKTEPEAVTQERCEQHRKNLETLENKPIVRRQNPDSGEMEVLDQDARNKMIEDTRQALSQCPMH